MIKTRLVLIEGMMGSGKSTLAVFLSQQMRKYKIKQKRVLEAEGAKHPTTVLLTLPDWRKPWLHVNSEQYMRLCSQSWSRFAAKALLGDTTYVYDGQFWHGDFTVLMMMDTPKPALRDYARRLEKIVCPLEPVFIYLYQNPVDEALERIASTRGKGWVKHQITWKTESPYCVSRGYSGRDGWVRMYNEYRALTDELFDDLQIPKLAINISAQNWPEFYRNTLEFLGLSDGHM